MGSFLSSTSIMKDQFQTVETRSCSYCGMVLMVNGVFIVTSHDCRKEKPWYEHYKTTRTNSYENSEWYTPDSVEKIIAEATRRGEQAGKAEVAAIFEAAFSQQTNHVAMQRAIDLISSLKSSLK